MKIYLVVANGCVHYACIDYALAEAITEQHNKNYPNFTYDIEQVYLYTWDKLDKDFNCGGDYEW